MSGFSAVVALATKLLTTHILLTLMSFVALLAACKACSGKESQLFTYIIIVIFIFLVAVAAESPMGCHKIVQIFDGKRRALGHLRTCDELLVLCRRCLNGLRQQYRLRRVLSILVANLGYLA